MSATVEEIHQTAISLLYQLKLKVEAGDTQACRSLRNLGLFSAQLLEALVFEETVKSNGPEIPVSEKGRGGITRELARNSEERPFRLSAIEEKRHGYKDKQTGEFRRTMDNPEVMVEFLRLGSATEIQTGKSASTGGASREFQGRSGFALRSFKQIQQDLKQYAGRTASQLRESRYSSWNFNLDPDLGPIVPMERPPALHRLLQAYIERARKLKSHDIDELTEVAILGFRVALEDDLERVGYWPSAVEGRKLKKDGTYEASLRDYLKAGFKSIMKKDPRNLSG
jgi:hypothetical protein